jgi:hypothetical protein
MVSSIYKSNYAVWEAGSRKGKTKKQIELEESRQVKKKKYSNEYTPSVKKTLVFSKQQRILINTILDKCKNKLNSWETNLLINISKSATYTEKQRDVLNTIYKKVKNNLKQTSYDRNTK